MWMSGGPVAVVQQRSDLGAVGARRGRKHVRGTVVTQRGGARRVCRQGKRDRPVLVVGVEAQPLPPVTQAVCESGAARVRRTGGTVVVVRAGVQLVQRDGDDGGAVHGESVAGIAGKVRERVCSCHGAHVHLGIILLTAVILEGGARSGRRRAEVRLQKSIYFDLSELKIQGNHMVAFFLFYFKLSLGENDPPPNI